MPHDNAPATTLLATHCAVCGRALVDAQSVETGIGPICRQRYFSNEALTESARVEANAIVYRVAAALSADPTDGTLAQVSTDLQRLRDLGADTIVTQILNNRGRLATIKLHVWGTDTFAIAAPRNADLTAAFRNVPGRQWWGATAWHGNVRRVNVFPRWTWAQVRDALRTAFGDAFVRMPDGSVQILTASMTPGFDVPAAPTVLPPSPAQQAAQVTITITEVRAGVRTRIGVATPYNETVVAAMRNVSSRRWDRDRRLNTFLPADLGAVLAIALRQWPDAHIDNRTGYTTRIAQTPTAPTAPAQPRRIALAPADASWLTLARDACSDMAPAVEYRGTLDHASWLRDTLTECLRSASFTRVDRYQAHAAGLDGRTAVAAEIDSMQVFVLTDALHDGITVTRIAADGTAAAQAVPTTGTIAAIVSAVINAAAAIA